MTSAVVQSKAIWYLMRASGLVSLLLLTGTLVLGIATANRWRAGALPRSFAVMVHRSVSLLSVAFLAIHVATAVLDPYAHVALVATVAPGISSSEPLWVGLGAAGLDLVAALVITSLVRGRIPPRIWRAVHWLAYLCWPVAFAHGVGMGTDARTFYAIGVDVVCAAAVAAAVAWRLRERHLDGDLPKHRELRASTSLEAMR